MKPNLPALVLSALVSVCFAVTSPAQERGPNVAQQREAMLKLGFLAGHWVGEASVTRGPGDPVKIQQTEEVQYKLDGLVLLIEGTGRNAEGKTVFSALATISYDEATQTYRFHAHSGGRYLDTELKVAGTGFEWGFSGGPLTVRNSMSLDAAGDWVETTEAKMGENPSRRTLEMTLKKVRP